MIRTTYHIVSVLWALLLIGLFSACAPEERIGEKVLRGQELANFDWKISISFGFLNNEPRLYIKQSFIMPRPELTLMMPDTFLRKERLYQQIEDLSVSTGGSLQAHPRQPAVKYLLAPPGDRVEISYYFRPDNPIPYGTAQESFSAPIIRDDFFQFVGLMALIYPIAIVRAQSFPLTLEWDLPEGFVVYNSYGPELNVQHVTTDFDRLRDSLFVAGKNMRNYRIEVLNRPVYLTFQGAWTRISPKNFIDTIGALLEEQRRTFRDDNFPYFLVNLLSVKDSCNGNVKFAGTAHPNSFRAFFPSQCDFLPEMKQLISHELMHIWIGKKIKVGRERHHIDGKWFTEGWTDYFGRILAYRAGVINEQEYFDSLNRQLGKYYESSERLVTLRNLVQRMYKRGFSNRDLENVPYQQGEIMAWRLNMHIKKSSKGRYNLDDVIRDLLAEADRAGGSKNFSVAEIAAAVDRYIPGVFMGEFNKVLHGGLFIPPNLGNCRTASNSYLTASATRARRNGEVISYGPQLNSCDYWLR